MLRDLQILQNLVPVVDMVAVMNSSLTAWRHYYCSTGSLHDSDIDLARKCLSLAPDTVREVQDCYDLIAALQSLADFGLGDVLPVTVLNCKDRMEFVRKAVEAKHNAYKNTETDDAGQPTDSLCWC